jgi:FkbM family methyltransferase
MSVSTGPMDEPAAWWLRLRLLYRAYCYRWRDDAAEIACVRRWVRPGSVALDVGAHKGGYTYWLARSVGPRGRVYAFEPQQVLARILRRSFDPARVIVEHAGVSDREGTMTLYLPSDGRPSPGASLEKNIPAPGCAIEVRVITLDRYWPTWPAPVSFLKCDVEGHELHVFRGAEQLLRRDRPVLLFECEQRHHGDHSIAEVFAYLEQLGYRGSFFERDRLRPLRDFRAEIHQRSVKDDGYCNNFLFTAAADA